MRLKKQEEGQGFPTPQTIHVSNYQHNVSFRDEASNHINIQPTFLQGLYQEPAAAPKNVSKGRPGKLNACIRRVRAFFISAVQAKL